MSGSASALVSQSGPGWIALVHPTWREALENDGWLHAPPAAFASAAPPTLPAVGAKRAGRGVVFRHALGPGAMIVRPLRRGGWLSGWLGARLLRAERPLEEARATATLGAAGAAVPEMVMALSWRGVDRFWRGLVATREIPDALNGHEWLRATRTPAQRSAGLAAAGVALRRFHDAGGRHRDLNLGNLLICEPPASPARAWVIDLDGARVAGPPTPRRRMRELMRLFRSLRKARVETGSADRAERRLAASLFHHYCDGNRELRAEMLRWRPLEEARVALHALRYRSR